MLHPLHLRLPSTMIYLTTFGQQLQCPNGLVPTSNLLNLAKTQVNLLEESKLTFIFNNCYFKANYLSY